MGIFYYIDLNYSVSIQLCLYIIKLLEINNKIVMRNFLKIILSIGISFAILALLLNMVSGGLPAEQRPDVLQVLMDTSLSLVAAFLLVYVVLLFIRAVRYRLLLKVSGEPNVPSLGQMTLVTGVRNMTVDMLPARLGELVYIGLLNRGYGVKLETSATSLALSIAFDFVALVFIIAAIIFKQIFSTGLQGWALGAFIVAILLSLIAFAMLFVVVPLVVRYVEQGKLVKLFSGKWGRQLLQLMHRFSESIQLAQKSGALTKLVSLSVLIRVLKYTAFYLLFMAVVIPSFSELAALPSEQIVSALVGGEIGASLPIPAFMSFGTYEVGGTLVFSLLGVDKASAAVSLLVTHIWSQLFDYSLGLILLVVFIMLMKRKQQQKRMPVWLVWGASGLIFLAGSVLLAKEYQANKKMGSLTAPATGESQLQQQVEVLTASQTELQGTKGYVVWSSNRNGNHDILKMSLPDMAISSVTTHPHTEYYPRISPDGTQLVFSRSRQPWVSQRNLQAWDVIWKNLKTGEEKRLAENATMASWLDNQHVSLLKDADSVVKINVKSNQTELLYKSGVNNQIPAGANIITPEYNPNTSQLVFTGRQAHIGLRTGSWGTALMNPNNQHQGIHNGCQIAWSSDGSYLYQVTKGGHQTNRFMKVDPKTYELSPWLDLQGEFSHEYFPKDAWSGTHLVFAASRGDHEHDAADYEIFLWKIGSDPGKATRLTFHSGNDNWPDVYIK